MLCAQMHRSVARTCMHAPPLFYASLPPICTTSPQKLPPCIQGTPRDWMHACTRHAGAACYCATPNQTHRASGSRCPSDPSALCRFRDQAIPGFSYIDRHVISHTQNRCHARDHTNFTTACRPTSSQAGCQPLAVACTNEPSAAANPHIRM